MNKNKRILDYIDNIYIDEDFPFNVNNMHSLYYLVDGIYDLAKKVRKEELRAFNSYPDIIFMGNIENWEKLMNDFNWFSINLINYVRLIGFIDIMNKNGFNHDDLIKNRKPIKDHCYNYIIKIIPEIYHYRNKLAAHHALSDPFPNDNIMTLEQSVCNNIAYYKPFFKGAGFKLGNDEHSSTFDPWKLTQVFENLSSRYWPHLKLEPFPKSRQLTQNEFNNFTIENARKGRPFHSVNHAKLPQDSGEQGDDDIRKEYLIIAMFHKVQTLKTVNDKIAVYDEIIEKYGQSDDLGIQKYIAESMLNKGILIEKPEEKTTIYEDIIKHFGQSKNIIIQEIVIQANLNKAVLIKKPEDAVAVYDEVIKNYGNSDYENIQSKVIIALYDKAITINSEKIFNQIIVQYGNSHNIQIQKIVLLAMFKKSSFIKKPKEKISALNKIIERFGKNNNEIIQSNLVVVSYNRARLLNTLADFDEFIEQYKHSTDTDTLLYIYSALIDKSKLKELSQDIEDEIIERFWKNSDEKILIYVARAMFNKASKMNTSKDKIIKYDEIIKRFNQSKDNNILEVVSKAKLYKDLELKK